MVFTAEVGGGIVREKLKAPFPAFGGKSRVASLVWQRLGDVDNFVEPFANSAAVLLARPHPARVETANDINAYIANFWRALRHDPEAVADHADWPVNETDLHARHRWLVLSEEAVAFRGRMKADPDYFDARIAGWWCWGCCCWIGGEWCNAGVNWQQTPDLSSGGVDSHAAAAALPQRRPLISGDNPGSHGKGVHAKGEPPLKRPVLEERGIHASLGLSQQVPMMSAPGRGMDAAASEDCSGLAQKVPNIDSRGVLGTPREGRPQLADAFARGWGIHGNDDAGTCAQRRAWLLGWFGRLADRLRTVRVCCGHWLRVCDSDSVTTRLGITGLFLDPPYPTHTGDGGESRANNLYAGDDRDTLDRLRDEVLAYCRERGSNRLMRIAVCGYDTDGYAALEQEGWQCVAWKAQGGYGNRTETGKSNAGRERIWFSPHCNNERGLFDALPLPGTEGAP